MAGLQFYLQAYQELCTEKNIGMAVGLIPWYSIVRWCKHYNITDNNDIDIVIRYVRALENAANDWHKKREERQNKRAK